MIKIFVYLDDGRVMFYEINDSSKAREHSHAIIMTGYRHTENGVLEHYPPHRILKVKCVGDGIDTNYPDKVIGT